MKLIKVTEEQIRNGECRAYNPENWDNVINRFKQMRNVQFYLATETHNQYTEYFATYEIADGTIFLNRVEHSTALTDNGFCRIEIQNDGSVVKHLYGPEQNKYIALSVSNLKIMSQLSKQSGYIWTKAI